MAKDPAFLFYPSDFLTGTMFLSNEQIGIYIRLLCSQHQHGGLIDKLSFDSLVGNNHLLRSKFIENENGFYNERLTIEVSKRNKKSTNMSNTAKEVWEKRKLEKEYNCNTNVKEINTNVKENDTNVMQTVNVNKDIYIYNNTAEKSFLKPSVSEIKDYCLIRNNNVDSETFFDFYESKGWVVGKSKMKDWRASIRTWEKSNINTNDKKQKQDELTRITNEIRNREN